MPPFRSQYPTVKEFPEAYSMLDVVQCSFVRLEDSKNLPQGAQSEAHSRINVGVARVKGARSVFCSPVLVDSA